MRAADHVRAHRCVIKLNANIVIAVGRIARVGEVALMDSIRRQFTLRKMPSSVLMMAVPLVYRPSPSRLDNLCARRLLQKRIAAAVRLFGYSTFFSKAICPA